MKGTFPRHMEPQKDTSVQFVGNSLLSIQICLNTEHKFIYQSQSFLVPSVENFLKKGKE